MDNISNGMNNLISNNKSSKITMIAILIIIGLVFYNLFNILPFSTTSKKFRSHHIPYIPKNLKLKDKDNKISRHLKFRYVYTCPADIFNQITNASNQTNNVRELFYFKKDDNLWIGFFVIETEDIDLPNRSISEISEYPYKLYDTYVLGETRIFTNIEDILINQGYDRDAYGENSISTTYLNEICSNKIEYIKYFLKHGLMLGTWIKPYRKNEENIFPNMYVKAPYSSRSACASLNKIDSKLCYLDDGIIVQEENKTLGKYELKCYVLDGRITMKIMRLNGQNFNMCIPDDMKNVPSDIKKIINKYKKEIEEVCMKVYYYMNALIAMRVAKLENDTIEAKKIIDELKNNNSANLTDPELLRIKYILTGIINIPKVDLITSLNNTYSKSYDVEKLTRDIVDYPDPFDQINEIVAYDYKSKESRIDTNNFSDIMSNIKIYDRFMRVDMALPDTDQYGVYNKITVTEIEPLASGIYLYKTIGPCMKDDDLNTFDNIVKYNLHSIISSIDNSNSQMVNKNNEL